MKRVVFIFDRVAHYHRRLFVELERRLAHHGAELHLVSGRRPPNSRGRTGLDTKVIENEHKFHLRDIPIGSFVFRPTTAYLPIVEALHPRIVVCPAHPGDLGHWRLISRKKQLNYRLVAWQCGFEYNPSLAKRCLLRRFVPGFDLHLAYHTNARAYALRHGADASQVVVMHNTIDEAAIDLLPKDQARALIDARHPAVSGKRLLLFVGAVLEEKLIERTVAALAQLRDPQLALLVVGDGPHLPRLRRCVQGRPDIVLAGEVIDGVGTYFDAADAYVLPGTGGLGINEAMAHGLPILAGYADGSADDLVIDGENGYRLRAGSVDELADRIRSLMSDARLRAGMGRRSREWITGRFSFASFINRIEQALLPLLSP